ncbi:hypothetical protein [Demequina oxidasica]|uniref:hypothetical protein n=1 Tax=Demequina oxidasica TaxID=676199 RepID=UPI000780F332|nr:hypothetical protein [Demequina oxidasica]
MSASNEPNFIRQLAEAAQAEQMNADSLYIALRDGGYLNKATLQRYRCKRGCALAVIYSVADTVYCATEDYKYSPGLNAARSVETARVKNTLDGNRHWPGHVFEVASLAEWGSEAGMDVACRHVFSTLNAQTVLDEVAGITPGHPKAPVLM